MTIDNNMLETNPNHNAENGGNSVEKDTLQRIKERIEWYARQVFAISLSIEETDIDIVNAQSKQLQERNTRMFTESAKEHGNKKDKQIRILERRLNHALLKFNEKIANNKQLREKIDERRRERVAYDIIYTKIERELHERAIEMKEILMEGCKAVKERDKGLSDVEALKQQIRETAKSLQEEQRGLNELIERNDSEKGKEEGCSDDEKRNLVEPSKASTVGKARIEDNATEPCSEVKPIGWVLNSPDRIDIDSADGVVNSIDVDALLASFLEADEKKLSILNHLSELSIEKETIEKEILRTNKEIEGLTRTNLKPYIVSSVADSKSKRIEGKTFDYQEKRQTAEKVLNSLKVAIKDVYYQIKCDSFIPGASMVLGGTVTDSNVMQYLAIIEQCAADIVQKYGINRANTDGEWPMIFTAAREVPSMPFHIDPPCTDDEIFEGLFVDDDDGRPLTTKELQLKMWS